MIFEDRYFAQVVIMQDYCDDFSAEMEYEMMQLVYCVGEKEAEVLCDDDACPMIGDVDDMG